MTAGLMRRLSASTRFRRHKLFANPTIAPGLRPPQRTLANVRERDSIVSETWFSSSYPFLSSSEVGGPDNEPPDQRTLQLGKTIRVLHERLPTLLNSPLPQEILSPQITLHLFPSTHPHLPTVKGKIAYTAALWTAPVAWGRVPVVGNVKLHIMSERMVKHGGSSVPHHLRHEKLIVRWKTCTKEKEGKEGGVYRGISASEQMQSVKEILRGESKDDSEFTGLFVFEFDEEGRIASHTIEHAEDGSNLDKTTKVISVTDWLLGKAWGKRSEEGEHGLALGFCRTDERRPCLKGRRERNQG